MTGSESRLVYDFSGFRLDPQQRRLVGRDGQPIPISPRVLDTLLFFVERRGELLDKHTLMKAIWPSSVVEENSLNQKHRRDPPPARRAPARAPVHRHRARARLSICGRCAGRR